MHAHNWIAWLLLAAVFLILPVLLRFGAGDDEPDNSIRQEQPGDEEREPDPEALPSLAVRLAA
jgi:hypothetical protein